MPIHFPACALADGNPLLADYYANKIPFTGVNCTVTVTSVIPEPQTFVLLPLFMTLTLLAVATHQRRPSKTAITQSERRRRTGARLFVTRVTQRYLACAMIVRKLEKLKKTLTSYRMKLRHL
jgi:hypothetical protein